MAMAIVERGSIALPRGCLAVRRRCAGSPGKGPGGAACAARKRLRYRLDRRHHGAAHQGRTRGISAQEWPRHNWYRRPRHLGRACAGRSETGHRAAARHSAIQFPAADLRLSAGPQHPAITAASRPDPARSNTRAVGQQQWQWQHLDHRPGARGRRRGAMAPAREGLPIPDESIATGREKQCVASAIGMGEPAAGEKRSRPDAAVDGTPKTTPR